MSNPVKNTYLGIDIGFNSVKIAVMSREKDGRLKITQTFCAEYDHFPLANFQEQIAAIENIFEKFFRRNKSLQKVRAGIVVAGQAAFIRMVSVPLTTAKKLHQIIMYETQQQVPFPIKDVAWDFQIYGREKKQLHVILAAVKKELVMSILKIADAYGLDVEFIDVSNLALHNCLSYFYRDLQQTLVIDCGAKTTNVIVLNDTRLWTRSLPIGGDDITEAVARALSIPRDEAERIKKEKGKVLMIFFGRSLAPRTEEEQIAEAITSVLTDIANEIVKSLNFYKSLYNTPLELKKVLLTGGVSRTENIAKFFENSLSVPAEKVDYFGFIHFHHRVNTQDNEVFGAAAGAALRGIGRSALNLNLLPPEQVRVKNFRKKIPFLIGSLAVIAALLLNQAFVLAVKQRRLAEHRALVEKMYRQVGIHYSVLEQLQKGIIELRKTAQANAQAARKRRLALVAFEAVGRSLPGSVWVEGLIIDAEKNRIELSGRCGLNLNEIAQFQQKLAAEACFREARINTVNRTDETIDFSMTLIIEPGTGN